MAMRPAQARSARAKVSFPINLVAPTGAPPGGPAWTPTALAHALASIRQARSYTVGAPYRGLRGARGQHRPWCQDGRERQKRLWRKGSVSSGKMRMQYSHTSSRMPSVAVQCRPRGLGWPLLEPCTIAGITWLPPLAGCPLRTCAWRGAVTLPPTVAGAAARGETAAPRSGAGASSARTVPRSGAGSGSMITSHSPAEAFVPAPSSSEEVVSSVNPRPSHARHGTTSASSSAREDGPSVATWSARSRTHDSAREAAPSVATRRARPTSASSSALPWPRCPDHDIKSCRLMPVASTSHAAHWQLHGGRLPVPRPARKTRATSLAVLGEARVVHRPRPGLTGTKLNPR